MIPHSDPLRAQLQALIELAKRRQCEEHERARGANPLFSKAHWEHNAGPDWPDDDGDSYIAFENCRHPDCVLVRADDLAALLRREGDEPEQAERWLSLEWKAERWLRLEWWLNHGHSRSRLYDYDGEMQCAACAPMWDYRRAPLAELRKHVESLRSRVPAISRPEEP